MKYNVSSILHVGFRLDPPSIARCNVAFVCCSIPISWWLRWLQGHISGLKMVFSPFSILFLSSQAGFFKISSRYFYNSRRVAMGIFYVWWWWRTNHWCCWRWRGSTITPTLWWPPTFWFWWTTQSTKSIVHFTLSPLHCVAVQLTFCAHLNIAVTCHY